MIVAHVMFVVCFTIVAHSLTSISFNRIQGTEVNEKAIFVRMTLPLTYMASYGIMGIAYLTAVC